MNINRIVILTGAGLSAEAGLSNFQDKDGVWYRIKDVATPEAFVRNPAGVPCILQSTPRGGSGYRTQRAHRALAQLETEHPGKVLTVTQNIDPLHERAGTKNLIQILKAVCAYCGFRDACESDLLSIRFAVHAAGPVCCGPMPSGSARLPYRMDEIHEALAACDLFRVPVNAEVGLPETSDKQKGEAEASPSGTTSGKEGLSLTGSGN